MAFQSHRTRFKGDLAGVEQKSIIELDYTKEKIKDRLQYIERKYDNVGKYHEEYTTDFYKVNVNTDDNLSADINIFKAIERDGSYLLNSLDIPRDKQHKYNILTQEEFDEMLKKEAKEDITDDAFKNILASAPKNDYINMDLKITPKDLKEDSEMGCILRDYDRAKTHVKGEILKIKDKQESYLNVYSAKLLSGTIGCDMLDVKKSYKGITRPSNKLGDIGSLPDYSSIKYSDPKHIRAIISVVKLGDLEPDSELSHIAFDIKVAIEELYKRKILDDRDLYIIEGVNSGVSMRKLAKELGIKHQSVSERFSKVVDKIALYHTHSSLELE